MHYKSYLIIVLKETPTLKKSIYRVAKKLGKPGKNLEFENLGKKKLEKS